MSTKDYQLYPSASNVVFADNLLSKKQFYNNSGTLTGASFDGDKITNDNVDDYFEYTNQAFSRAMGVGQARSIAFWFKSNGSDGLTKALLANNTFIYLRVMSGTNYIQGYHASSGTATQLSGFCDGKWHRLCYTCDGGANGRLVRDGTSTNARVDLTAAAANDGNAIRFGSDLSGIQHLSCEIKGPIIVTNKFLSYQEIEDDYKNATYNYMNEARGLWFMKDSSGGKTSDLSGKVNDLLLGAGANAPTKLVTRNGFQTDGGDFLYSAEGLHSASNRVTMFVYCKLVNLPAQGMVAHYDHNVLYTGAWFSVYNTGQFRFGCGTPLGAGASYIVDPSLEGKKVFAIGVHDGTNTTLYYNGIKQTSATSPASPSFNSQADMHVFCSGNETLFCGSGTEVYALGFWDKALTPTQIQDLINKGEKLLGNN